MKKLVKIVLAALMIMSLGACSSNKTSGENNEENTGIALPAEGTTVTIWHTFTNDQLTTLEAIAEEFNKTNEYGITVKVESQTYDGFLDTVKTNVYNGTGPDMILNYASAAADYVTDELVVDLSQYINDSEIGIEGYYESKPAGVIAEESAFEDGQQHIIITQQTGPIFFYNKTVYDELGLKPAKISTQIISRDRHAKFFSQLALIASLIEQSATEIRHLQKTEVREVEEGFGKNQKGSSAMPHKKNPVLCENLCGLARVVRSNMLTAYENINLWHERDISHSSAERIIFPDSLILIDFMLHRFNGVMENLVVHEDNMLKNTKLYGGIVYSQKVLLKLVDKGLTRENDYRIVQKHALDALNGGHFKDALYQDTRVTNLLTQEEIESCFDVADYLKNIEKVFERFEG